MRSELKAHFKMQCFMQLQPDTSVTRQLMKLKVQCQNHCRGCQYKGTWDYLNQHQEECGFRNIRGNGSFHICDTERPVILDPTDLKEKSEKENTSNGNDLHAYFATET